MVLEHLRLRGLIKPQQSLAQWLTSHSWLTTLQEIDVENTIVYTLAEDTSLHHILRSEYRLSEMNEHALYLISMLNRSAHITIDRTPTPHELGTLLHHDHTWEYTLTCSDIPLLFEAMSDSFPWREYLFGLLVSTIHNQEEERNVFLWLKTKSKLMAIPPCQWHSNLDLFSDLVLQHKSFTSLTLCSSDIIKGFFNHLNDGLHLTGEQFSRLFGFIMSHGWFVHLKNRDLIQNIHIAACLLEHPDAQIFAFHCEQLTGHTLPTVPPLDYSASSWTYNDFLSMLLYETPSCSFE